MSVIQRRGQSLFHMLGVTRLHQLARKMRSSLIGHSYVSSASRHLLGPLTELFLEWIDDLKGNFNVDWP